MHLKNVFLAAMCFLLFSSCSKTIQVFEVSPASEAASDPLTYENDDLKLNYNFWADQGAVAFTLTNKSSAPIYINWDKSHLMFNGISYDYWLDSEESSSITSSVSSVSSSSFANSMATILSGNAYGKYSSTASTQGRKTTSSYSSKKKPKRVIQIPPRASIIVSKFSIMESPYFDCDFNSKNLGSKPRTKTFAKNNSPLVFRNYITYSKSDNFLQEEIVDNEYYVSAAHFMTDAVYKGKMVKDKACDIYGGKKSGADYSYPYNKPGSFYMTIVKK